MGVYVRHSVTSVYQRAYDQYQGFNVTVTCMHERLFTLWFESPSEHCQHHFCFR